LNPCKNSLRVGFYNSPPEADALELRFAVFVDDTTYSVVDNGLSELDFAPL